MFLTFFFTKEKKHFFIIFFIKKMQIILSLSHLHRNYIITVTLSKTMSTETPPEEMTKTTTPPPPPLTVQQRVTTSTESLSLHDSLPVKFLQKFRCVCTSWNSLISKDSEFVKKHLRMSRTRRHLFIHLTIHFHYIIFSPLILLNSTLLSSFSLVLVTVSFVSRLMIVSPLFGTLQ